MAGFVGREHELDSLGAHLNWVRSGQADQRGRAVLLRGRRRVGKSRLVDVFCARAGVPQVLFQATRGQSAAVERERFLAAIRQSDLPDTSLLEGIEHVAAWDTALRQLAAVLPDDQPSIVVLDEFPWLIEGDPVIEGALQTVWDRALSHKPVLLIIIGSDLAIMDHLSDYGRPFHQRGVEMQLAPLNPLEVGHLTGLAPADAFDAYLITGGLPLICQEWRAGESRTEFLTRTLQDPTSPLLVSGERSLAAEFRSALQARTVLTAVGSGERTFTSITRAAGSADHPLAAGTLNPLLKSLARKQLLAVDIPLSTKPGDRDRRYRVADPYLRFWLAFLEAGINEVERGRGSQVAAAIERSWRSWRGRAIEPVIREALARLLPDQQWPQARQIGGWWPRTNRPELDLVAADREPARVISFVGSIKWLEGDGNAFGTHDYAALARDALAVPGVDETTPLIAVSRSGCTIHAPAAVYEPEQLIQAWA
jgi:AAA+ ATPase superfamily predicted ATPase